MRGQLKQSRSFNGEYGLNGAFVCRHGAFGVGTTACCVPSDLPACILGARAVSALRRRACAGRREPWAIPRRASAILHEARAGPKQAHAVASEIYAVAPESHAVAPETEVLAREVAAVVIEEHSIAFKTYAVAPKIHAVASKTHAVAPKTCTVASEADAVALGAKAGALAWAVLFHCATCSAFLPKSSPPVIHYDPIAVTCDAGFRSQAALGNALRAKLRFAARASAFHRLSPPPPRWRERPQVWTARTTRIPGLKDGAPSALAARSRSQTVETECVGRVLF